MILTIAGKFKQLSYMCTWKTSGDFNDWNFSGAHVRQLNCPASARIISFNSSLKQYFTNISFNINNHNNNTQSILSSQLYHDNSQGDVGVDLASWIVRPQSGTRKFWQTGKCLWTSWPCYGRITSLVVNCSSSLIELQPQCWRLASVSCWPVQTNGEYLLSLAPNAHVQN